ncbi:hypothetical protein HDV01_001294 [Terramyces sp. JEL0728]|nr:hypothetical protein HDV01_001294 [Terramyces sp. JEL0728]
MRGIARLLSRTSIRKMSAKRADPDPIFPVGFQIWEQQQTGKPKEYKPQVNEKEDFLVHPLYTPPAETNTGFESPLDKLPKPLHFPEYDQSTPPVQKIGKDFPNGWSNVSFGNAAEDPIGTYPRLEKQYAILKDAHSYWDQQDRRNYGEIVQDNDTITNIWGIGVERSMGAYLKGLAGAAGLLGFVAFGVYLYSPEKHVLWAEKDLPFDGLRLELGGDPKDPEDKFFAANTYKL